MVRGGRREQGSGWGTRVYLWRIHVDTRQNQYNIVKLKNKIKKKLIVPTKALPVHLQLNNSVNENAPFPQIQCCKQRQKISSNSVCCKQRQKIIFNLIEQKMVYKHGFIWPFFFFL